MRRRTTHRAAAAERRLANIEALLQEVASELRRVNERMDDLLFELAEDQDRREYRDDLRSRLLARVK